jgi:hypothetical protein
MLLFNDYYFGAGPRWHPPWSLLLRCRHRAHARARLAAADPAEEVVLLSGRDDRSDRDSSVRLHLHRDVLHLHLVLELQILLRLRVHAPRPHHSLDRLGLHHDCDDVLPPQLGGLPLAVGLLPLLWEHGVLCVSVLRLLLLCEDEHEWFDANDVLLWLHGPLLLCDVRCVSVCVCLSLSLFLFLFLSIYLCVCLSLRFCAFVRFLLTMFRFFTHRWIMCGTIGRAGADLFVRSIFRNLKFD